MCGTPERSRTTRTDAVRPRTAIVPDTCGSAGGADGAGAFRQASAASSDTTHRRTAPQTPARRVMPCTLPLMLKEALLAEFDHETEATRRLLERIPGDKLTWRPDEKSRTLGALAAHIGQLPRW